MKKIAFIGSGTMGTALATAACKGIDPSEVVITDVVTEKGQKLADELGCNFVETNGEAIKAAHYVVFCVILMKNTVLKGHRTIKKRQIKLMYCFCV